MINIKQIILKKEHLVGLTKKCIKNLYFLFQVLIKANINFNFSLYKIILIILFY